MHRITRLLILIVSIAAPDALSRDAVHAQAMQGPQRVEIPAGATSLEGIPTVRIDSTEGSTTRQILQAAEAAKARLTISVVDGQFYWATRGDRLLRLNAAGEFTYLSSEPGQYIRFTRIKDRIAYVEHVDVASGSVTWFGELRIVVGK